MKIKQISLIIALFLTAACEPQQSAEENTVNQKTQTAQPVEQQKEITQSMDKLMFPSQLEEKAPESFKVKFNTTKGDFTLEVTRAWAPLGADRFYNLVKNGFFTDIAFFRVIKGFMVQFGIHGDPKISAQWREAIIEDDNVKQSNTRGYISFATAGPNTRTTQMFINFGNNSFLDHQGFSPFGKVIEGMDIVDSIYNGYGEGEPSGNGPNQGAIQAQGNTYLKGSFEKLDYIKSASIL